MDDYYKEKDREKHERRLAMYRLDEKDDFILRHLIQYPNTKVKELSEILNLGHEAISNRIKKPAFQKALKDIKADAWDLVKRSQEKALRRLMKIIETGKDKDAIDASRIVLNPMFQQFNERTAKDIKEVIYATRFGEGGQMIAETKEIESTTPKSTLDLMTGKKDDKKKKS